MSMTGERAKELLNEAIRIAIENVDIDGSLTYLSDIGCTRSEALQYIDNHFLCDYDWEEEDKNEEQNKQSKSVPVPDYFRLIEMLDKVKAPYTNFKKERMIEIKKDYEAVSFFFDENFNLREVAF